MKVHLINSLEGFKIIKSFNSTLSPEKPNSRDDYFMSFLRMSKTKDNDPTQGFYIGKYKDSTYLGRCSFTKFQKRPFEVATVVEIGNSDFDHPFNFIQYLEFLHLTHLSIFSSFPSNLSKENLVIKINKSISKFNLLSCIDQFATLKVNLENSLTFQHPQENDSFLDQFTRDIKHIRIGGEKPYQVYGRKIGMEWLNLLEISSSIDFLTWIKNLTNGLIEKEAGSFRIQWNIPYDTNRSNISENLIGDNVKFLQFLERFFDLSYLSTFWNEKTNSKFYLYFQMWLFATRSVKSSNK